MKTLRIASWATVTATILCSPAWAVDTAKTYSSGLLVGTFLAFCALLVVAQLAPSLMLLIGFIRGLAHRAETKAQG